MLWKRKKDRPAEPGGYSLPLVVGAVGVAALVITAAMNWEFGSSLALAEYRRVLQGGSALVVDGMAVCLALIVGSLFNRGRWFLATVTALPLALYAVASIGGVVGFGSTERIAKARLAETHQQQAIDAAAEANARAEKQREDHIKWLRKEYAKARKKEEKDAIRDKLGEAAFGTIEVRQADVKSVMSDPQAIVISELSGLPVDRVQFLITVTLAVLLIAAKMLCFGFAAALWPRRSAPETSVKSETPPISDKGGSTGNTGGSETRTPATGDNVTPFPERKVSVAPATKGNSHDHDAAPPAPPVSLAVLEPAGTALVPVSHVSLPSARDLMIGPARPSKAQEPHVSVFPKITARDKGKERWETFEERYRDLDDLIAETDRMPPIRELAKRWECRPETVIKIRNRWSDLNEGPGGKRAAGKLPVRRERGNGKRPKLGNGLGELSGQYGPQHVALQ